MRFVAMVVMAALTIPAVAETRNLLEHPRSEVRRTSRLWKWSVAALAAGSAADAWSSWGKSEANPLLRGPGGRFSAKAIGIKSAIAGGSVAAQWIVLRKRPEVAKSTAISNFGMAALFTGVATRNRALAK